MDQIKIGKFIAALRKEKGLTQEQLGEKLGVTNKTISRWENGNYTPDVEMLALLSKEFGVSINELISGERLLAEDFKKAADNNLVAALNNSTFTLKEKIAFFKRKWLREHISTFVLCVVAWIGVKAKLFCPEIAGLFCRIAGLFCHDSRANLSLKPVCFGIAIS